MTQTLMPLGTSPTAISAPRSGIHSEVKFRELFNAIKGAGNRKVDPFQELQGIDRVLVAGKSIAPRELLTYQIKAGQFNLHVELISKVAESLTSTAKRLQQS